MTELWPHQDRALVLAGKEYSHGALAVCVVMPTGAGKTKTGGAAVSRHLSKTPSGTIIWVAHREELVTQAFDDLTSSWGLDCAVIQSNPTRLVNPHRPVQIASTQTLLARGIVPDATFAVFDECHHYASDTWIQLALEYRKRKTRILGLTATPVRGDGRGFDGYMDALVAPVTMKELIRDGFLTPFELHSPGRALRPNQIAQSPIAAYLEHAKDRKAIVFAGNVKAAREFRDQYRSVGISAELVWGTMPFGDRRRILESYKSGAIRVLTNVGVLTEGFDDPSTSCVILARAIGSLSLYLQMIGRGLRRHPGKKDCIIIDLHGTCCDPEFGAPDQDREWILEGDGVTHKTLERPAERFCSVCKVLIVGDVAECECGAVKAELKLPDIANVKLVKYAAKRREPEEKRRAYFNQLKIIARANGYSEWQPRKKYEAIYGEKAPRAWW